MERSSESSKGFFSNPGLQTPRNNKRIRSEDEDSQNCETVIMPMEKMSVNLHHSTQYTSTTQRYDYPPITIDFKSAHNKTDRKLIEEIIKEWKRKSDKDVDIIGRFGYKNLLLVFPRNIATLDELLDKHRWPNKIANSDYDIKFPKILPEVYSLVIHDFQLTWNEDEAIKELQEKYSTLKKLTRFVNREGRSMNIVRADFTSSQVVKQLLNLSVIDMNCMKLRIRPYFAPMKINKCRKCFKHDHFTNQCTSQQLCFRCGQHHPLKAGCHNEIKCVNCQQQHYSGHSSCPIVQLKRKQLAEQLKVQRAQLLIKQHQQHFHLDSSSFPPLSPSSHRISDQSQRTPENINNQGNHLIPPYAAKVSMKNPKTIENIQQMIMAISESINQQILTFTTTITSQFTELSKKLNCYDDRMHNLEQQLEKSIIPAIQQVSKIIDSILVSKDQHPNHQRTQPTSCSEMIQNIFQSLNLTTQTPRHKKQRPTTNLNKLQLTRDNNTSYNESV